ncbi:MAG: glycosyltransferase family 2 protein [Candidatus Dojkabacteria bacterium]|nr:glycosyltransferase family 2 protein [Candidatus Dojkabacteria bacterium]
MEPKCNQLCIIIVTWNSEKDIAECLNSIYEQTFTNFKIIVIDNDSSDNTCKIVQSYQQDKDNLFLIKERKNNFLTKANNKGIQYAIKYFAPSYILILNPDTILEKNSIELMINRIESLPNNICAIGPKVKFANSRDFGLINSAGLFYDGYLSAYDIGYLQKDNGQFDEEKEVFGVTGACILFRTEALIKVGLYWEKIKLYMDEVELFIRLQKIGYRVIYYPKAIVWHKYMQSTNKFGNKKITKIKNYTWLLIALRHYSIRKKISVIKWYVLNLIKNILK